MLTTERTSFTLDVPGRYVCNTWQEAMDSMDTSIYAAAKPFDVIVIGGGTFGSVFASHLFNKDKTRHHRILVLEAGPMLYTEHSQNLPMLGTGEVWGVPWNSDSPKSWNREFPGLAYAVGGRSLFWGGWSPFFIDSEINNGLWPQSVIDDLMNKVLDVGQPAKISYLEHAAQQIGSDTDNDFVSAQMHEELRGRLYANLSGVNIANTTLTGNQGALTKPENLEAPLAVQSVQPRPGFFPINKFSSTPLLIRAARTANDECQGVDARKRFMVVDNTHVIRLERNGNKIVRIHTNKGSMDVTDGAKVFIALGTIENTRMALNTLPNSNGLIGRNLVAHLRSNLTVRIKRKDLGDALDLTKHPELHELSVSALFVKGIVTHSDNTKGHFHLQITASGVGKMGMDSEAELWKKVPDIDALDSFRGNTDEYVVMTLRGIGEMTGDMTSPDPVNRVTLDRSGFQGPYDYGNPRALVRLEAGDAQSKNLAVWNAMDIAAEEVAQAFAPNAQLEYLYKGAWQKAVPPRDFRRDKLGTTHHEGGTCWMGDDSATSVTDTVGKFWEADNLYALGPCLLPSLGSPNPMLSGVALARRAVDKIFTSVTDKPEDGFTSLFDGTADAFKKWQPVGNGVFSLRDGQIIAEPGSDLGLIYHSGVQLNDFTLRLQFQISRPDDNSGVFVRFLNPQRPVPDPLSPAEKENVYNNQAYVAVDTGYEVQIDEQAKGSKGQPDGLEMHRTGAIYGISIGDQPGQQQYKRGPYLQPGVWNDLEIQVIGDEYTVRMRREGDAFMYRTTIFQKTGDFLRGNGKGKNPGIVGLPELDAGYIGLQSHTGRVAFRNVRYCIGTAPLPLAPEAEEGPAVSLAAWV